MTAKKIPKHVLGDVCDVVRRSDVFHIDPGFIDVVDGWNARTAFDDEDDLVASIKERGVIKPLLVRKTSDKRIELIDGERRLRAALRARAEGSDIKSVPVMVAPRGMNDADLFADSILSNTGKPLTPAEEADAFRRLIHWGYDAKMIAARSGKSVSHVRNRLHLADASPEVKAAVDAGEITIGQAQRIAKDSDGRIDDQKTKLSKVKARPKVRKLVLSFKKGEVRQTGLKGAACDPLREFLQNNSVMERISSAGFDPDSIRISINPAGGNKDPNQIPLWEQEPDENGKYTCPDCGEKVEKPDLCGPCYDAAAVEHKRKTVRDRAALSES